MNRIISRASVIAFIFAAALFVAPAHAQESQDANVQSGDAQGADPGDGAMPDPFKPRVNARIRNAAPLPPVPDDAPKTEKSGDDLIVHAPGGDITMPGFLRGVGPDEIGRASCRERV